MNELFCGLVVLEDHAPVEPGELDRAGHDGSQHGGQIEGRTDRAADLAERGELLDGSRQLAGARLEGLEQADVLDRDDRLIRKGVQELDLRVGGRSSLTAAQLEGADRRALAQGGTATDAWKPSWRAWCQVRGNSAATAATSGTWTTRCSSTLRAVMVSRASGRTRPSGEARGP